MKFSKVKKNVKKGFVALGKNINSKVDEFKTNAKSGVMFSAYNKEPEKHTHKCNCKYCGYSNTDNDPFGLDMFRK